MSVDYYFHHFTDGEISLFPRRLFEDAIAKYIIGSSDKYIEVKTIAELVFRDADDEINGFLVKRPGGQELYEAMLPLLQSLHLVWIMTDGTMIHAMDDFVRHVPQGLFKDFTIAKVASVDDIKKFIEG